MNKVKLSKTLSYILRHHPEDSGLSLNADGSVAVEELLAALKQRLEDISLTDIKEVVKQDKKGRPLHIFNINLTNKSRKMI